MKAQSHRQEVEQTPKSSESRIAVLGGSFNPVTTGHLSAAKSVLYDERVHAVLLVPCGPRPDKSSLQSPALERLLFCLEAIEESFESDIPVFASPLEVWEDVAVASADLIPTLRRSFGLHFSLIIGSDLIGSLSAWRNAETLTTQCSFVLIHREGYSQTLADCRTKLKEVLTSYAKESSLVVKSPLMVDVSSTQVKRSLKNFISSGPSKREIATYLSHEFSGLVPRMTIRRLALLSSLREEVLCGC